MSRRIYPLLVIFLLHALGAAAEGRPATVRVQVTEKRTAIHLTVKGAWLIRTLPSNNVILKGVRLSAKLKPVPGGFQLNDRVISAQSIALEARDDRDLYLDQTRFRGSMRFHRDASSNLILAVNHLDVESYLYGVLQHEVGAWWPMAALEAQAIAARTYALYQVQVSKTQLFDLKSSTSSQVYGGSTTERYRTKKAVDRTRGKVLTFEGKLFPGYFHATCAGRTAAASELWKIDLPPLGGGVACGYCRISPHYYWRASASFAEIEQKLKSSGRPVGQLLSVEAASRTPSYRIGRLKFTGNAGEAVIAAKDFRVWIGGDRLKSTSFSVECRDDTAFFRGKGWGHGVGLCQWGAFGQSLLGRSGNQILEFYYPHSDITDYGSVRI